MRKLKIVAAPRARSPGYIGVDRCSYTTVNAILRKFGETELPLDRCPITGTDIIRALENAGLKLTKIMGNPVIEKYNKKAVPLDMIMKDRMYARGAYLIITPGHAMAWVNSTLYDTSKRTGAQSVRYFARVSRNYSS